MDVTLMITAEMPQALAHACAPVNMMIAKYFAQGKAILSLCLHEHCPIVFLARFFFVFSFPNVSTP